MEICSLFLLLLFLVLMGCGKDQKEINPNPTFDFSLPDLNGKIHNMSEFSGQILVMNFWATWCPPCVDEVPKLIALYQKYRIKGIQVIGIALDKDSLNLLDQFVKRNAVTYPILVGNEKLLISLSKESVGKNLKGVPFTLLFDKKGQIYKRFDGSFDLEQLEGNLQILINQKN